MKAVTDTQHYDDIANAINYSKNDTESYNPSQLASETQALAENYRGAVSEIEEDNDYFNDIGEAIVAKDGGEIPDKSEMAGRIEAIPTGSDFDMTVTDNQVKMVIEVNNYDLSFWTRFGISGGGTVAVDWGDGTVDTYTGNTTLEYAPQRKHNYQKAGCYLVTETVENGILTIGSIGVYSTLSEGKIDDYYNSGDILRRMYNYKLKELAFGENISIYKGIANVPNVKILSDLGGYIYLYRTTTPYLNIKNGVTRIPEWALNEATIHIVKIPSSVVKIEACAFANAAIDILDFTNIQLNENHELPITFASTNIFNDTSNSMILLFATQEIAEVAKNTTNLSQLASQIKYVGEV